MKGALMKRTIPLLATTMTLAVLVFGGVALALEFTCGSNPCVGTPQNDTIHGTALNNDINARAGADFAEGKEGFDTIHGRKGRDELIGDNVIVSENCSDGLFGEGGADLLEGGCGSNFYHGGSGPDHIDAAFDDPNNATESVFGGPGKDTIDADDGNQDTIHCDGGTDTVNRDTEDRFPDNDCETQN